MVMRIIRFKAFGVELKFEDDAPPGLDEALQRVECAAAKYILRARGGIIYRADADEEADPRDGALLAYVAAKVAGYGLAQPLEVRTPAGAVYIYARTLAEALGHVR